MTILRVHMSTHRGDVIYLEAKLSADQLIVLLDHDHLILSTQEN